MVPLVHQVLEVNLAHQVLMEHGACPELQVLQEPLEKVLLVLPVQEVDQANLVQ